MKTVLSIGAHPDDIEFGCGGTESILKGRGYSIFHVIATLGGQGSLSKKKQELEIIRAKEAEKSAKLLGVTEVFYLGLEDGLTSFTPELKLKLIKLIRKIRPEILFIHASDDIFLDHKIIRSLTESALIAASGPWYAEAGGEPFQVPSVLGYEVWHPINKPGLAFDISSEIETKISSLLCHSSQIETTSYDDAVRALARYRGVMTRKGKYAEVFEVVSGGLLIS